MALEELIIKIKALYDNDGFSKAEAGLTKFRNGLSQTDGVMGKLNYSIQNFGKYAAMAFAAVVAGIVAFATIAIGKAMEAEKGWAIFAGAIGEASPEIAGVKAQFSGLFTEIARGTAQSAGAIRDTAAQLALLGFETSSLGTAVNDVAVIANLRFDGDMSAAQETYYKAVMGSERSLKNLGTTLEKLGYTSEQWQSMTLEQRAQILDTYLKENGWMQANENYLKTAAGKWQTINNELNKAVTNFGMMALELINNSGVLDLIIAALKWFNDNKGAQQLVVILAGVVTALLGIASLIWVLGTLQTSMAALGLVSAETGAIISVSVLGPLLAIAALGVIAVVIKVTDDWSRSRFEDPNYIQKLKDSGTLPQSGPQADQAGQMRGAMLGPMKPLYNMPGMGIGMDLGLQNYDKLGGVKGFGMSSMLGLDKLKFPDVKLEDIINVIKTKIPTFSWSIPSAQNLVKMISDFIAWLGWKIPTASNLVQMIRDFIPWLNWAIPTATDLVNMISGFISWLNWSIPSATDILNAIVSRMVGGAAGDERSMAEAAALKPITTSYIGGGAGGTTRNTINNSPVINIERIDSQETAEYFAQRVANELSLINDRKGR